MDVHHIKLALQRFGLLFRGGFTPGAKDGLADDIMTVVIVGNAGPNMWQVFYQSPEFKDAFDPLDAWSVRVIEKIANDLGAEAIFPFDGPPYFPFQRWAQKADHVWPSPIGPLIHQHFGLWHAYRGALLFRQKIDLEPLHRTKPPCETCGDKPCLSGCPVGAFSPDHYDVAACVEHLKSNNGTACMSGGCRARQACPVGQAYQYEPDHAQFHMSHFLRTQR